MCVIKTNRFNKCLRLRAVPLVACAYSFTPDFWERATELGLHTLLTSQVSQVGHYSNKNNFEAAQ